MCVSCTALHKLGKGCLGSWPPPSAGLTGQVGNGGQEPDVEPAAQRGQGGLACLGKASGGDFSWCAGTESEEQHLLAVYPLGFLQGIKRGLDWFVERVLQHFLSLLSNFPVLWLLKSLRIIFLLQLVIGEEMSKCRSLRPINRKVLPATETSVALFALSWLLTCAGV